MSQTAGILCYFSCVALVNILFFIDHAADRCSLVYESCTAPF